MLVLLIVGMRMLNVQTWTGIFFRLVKLLPAFMCSFLQLVFYFLFILLNFLMVMLFRRFYFPLIFYKREGIF